MRERLEQIRAAGIKRVEILGPGEGNYCCAACSLLVGSQFPIVNAPDLPPADCQCEGGSKLMYIAVEEKSPLQTSQAAPVQQPDLADKLQSIGCFLTIFVTIPIVIFMWLFLF